MAKERGGKLRFVYGIFLALFTVLVGCLFIAQVWSIYRSAPKSPYTVENISKHFKEIQLFVWLWLAAVLVNALLAFAFPEREKRPKAAVEMDLAIARTKKRLPKEKSYLARAQAVAYRHRKARILAGCICGAFALAATAVGILTALDVFYFPWIKKEFFAAHNAVADRLVQCASLSLLGLVLVCVAVVISDRSKREEQRAYLDIIAEAKTKEKEENNAPRVSPWKERIERMALALVTGEEAPAPCKKKERKEKPVKEERVRKAKEKKTEHTKAKQVGVWAIRVGLLAAGVALVIVGIGNGGMRDVLMKAINICTQCIGLG